MITNLPSNFPLDKLDDFIFGNVEADIDDLLKHELCVCKIRPINEFLKGRKNIIIGERGSGKTALFSLLRDKKIEFYEKSKPNQQIILAIDEDLQFKAINELINSKIKITSKKECLKYRFVWELFLLYRIAICLENNCKTNSKIKKTIETIKELFGGLKKKPSIFEMLLSQKKTIGCKVHQSEAQFPVPDFYLSTEPNKDDYLNEENQNFFTIINIEEYKRQFENFLSEQDIILYVMIDKLDAFVLKEEYEIQKEIIQGLLFAEKAYSRLKNIKLKIFLRSDIFKKLNFDELEYEKVASRKIELMWAAEDIREFIARRITYNYFNIFSLDRLEMIIDRKKYFIDKTSLSRLDSMRESFDTSRSLTKLKKNNQKKDNYEMRITNFNDVANRNIITTIFPRNIPHKDLSGNEKTISVFEYFSTHFNMSSDKTTPRIIISFFEHCFAKTREYYQRNIDIKELLLQNNEYPLLKKKLLAAAYYNLQNDNWEAICKVSKTWEVWINILKIKKKQGQMKYSYMKKIIQSENEEEIKQFLAFMTHLGVLKCKNNELPYDERLYSMPILFKKSFKP